MPNISIKDALNQVYLRQKPKTADFSHFCEQLEILKKNIDNSKEKKESEEHIKGFIKDFLKESFYKKTNLVNTKENIDWAIYETLENSSPVQVIIEVKRPGSNEFPTLNNLNSKAMQEAVLYYMRERIREKNIDLKHIVITNGEEWYVFDAADFEKQFMNNKDLVRHYKDFEINPTLFSEKTSVFYNEIASPVIDKVKADLPFAYIDLRVMYTDPQKVLIYKLLSPEHLLRKFVSNDSNDLNAPFYNELLYILGLEEVADGSKKKICRLKPSDRKSASFIENAIDKLEIAESNPDRQFEKALSLTITWINRILFLKLLESQLVNYHKGDRDYCFLNIEKIKGFDDLQQLFFKVLAVPVKERKPEVSDYRNVPYLNSSLFELTEIEEKCQISGLRDDNLPIHRQTVLRDSRNSKRLGGELPVLEYLLRFLDAYDFGSEPNDDSLTRDDRKTLINASVLGLIFEKINGYKDGSFFTPGFITQYMCRESLRRAVVQKFNEVKTWQCQNFDELADKDLDRTEANQIINSLRICDPAVGSGHFLVSALNELIAIKADLHILQRTDGRRLKNKIVVENDELMVYDEDGEPFVYNPKDDDSLLVQQSLFEEKRAIIENCLFGVDINPNSVNICQLRLWIELLKNAYYKQDGEFETLPNIDINIKCGNSLVSYYPLRLGKAVSAADSLKTEIKNYKACVKAYKYESNKVEKQKVKKLIASLKHKIAPGVQLSLELDEKDVEANRKALGNNIYRNSMEWMIEFPEVLDDEGNFKGFDAVIGNPPYGVSIKGNYRETLTRTIGKVPDYEIYYYFIAQSRKILKTDAVLSFIIPNTWLFNVYAKDWRSGLFNKWAITELLDCTSFSIFSSADVRNTIVQFQKTDVETKTLMYRPTSNVYNWENLIAKEIKSIAKEKLLEMNQNWGLAFKLDQQTISLVNKISKQSSHIGETYDVTQGYIPYRLSDLKKNYGDLEGKRIKDTRAWHSHQKSEKFWIQEIYGEDISKYNYTATGDYIYYGKHVGTYVDIKYFTGKRIIVREITNPKIIACVIEEQFLHDPQLIPIIPTNNSLYDLNIIWAILNSKLATYYHFNHSPKSTKGSFPKLMVEDVNAFPLPQINSVQQQTIIELVNQIFADKKQDSQADTSKMEKEIDLLVYHLYGLTFDDVKLIDENVTEEEFTVAL